MLWYCVVTRVRMLFALLPEGFAPVRDEDHWQLGPEVMRAKRPFKCCMQSLDVESPPGTLVRRVAHMRANRTSHWPYQMISHFVCVCADWARCAGVQMLCSQLQSVRHTGQYGAAHCRAMLHLSLLQRRGVQCTFSRRWRRGGTHYTTVARISQSIVHQRWFVCLLS